MIILFLILFGVLLFYFRLLHYTQSDAFVRKDVEALNKTYSYSSEEFRAVCDQMSAFSYVQGLTDGALLALGGTTYYYKSYCYQRLAIRTRNSDLCGKVRERYSLLDDGTSVSSEACLKRVAKARQFRREQVEKADGFKRTVAGSFVITELTVQQVSVSGWSVDVFVTGSLFGEYEFKILNNKLDIRDPNRVLLKQKATLDETITSFSLAISKTQFEQSFGSEMDPMNNYPIAVSLTLLRPHGNSTELNYLTSVENTYLSLDQ